MPATPVLSKLAKPALNKLPHGLHHIALKGLYPLQNSHLQESGPEGLFNLKAPEIIKYLLHLCPTVLHHGCSFSRDRKSRILLHHIYDLKMNGALLYLIRISSFFTDELPDSSCPCVPDPYGIKDLLIHILIRRACIPVFVVVFRPDRILFVSVILDQSRVNITVCFFSV